MNVFSAVNGYVLSICSSSATTQYLLQLRVNSSVVGFLVFESHFGIRVPGNGSFL